MPFETAYDQASNSTHSSGVLEDFAVGAMTSIRRPFDGAAQLAGFSNGPAESPKANESFSYKAGEMVGSAGLFLGTAALTKHIPFTAGYAGVAAGGALGFLEPTAPGAGISSRFESAAIGAGTMAAFEYAPGVLNKTGLLTDSVASGFGRAAFGGAAAGAFDVQARSLVNDHQFATLSDTAVGAASFAATGLAFHGIGTAIGRFTERPSNAPESTDRTAVEERIVPKYNDKIQFNSKAHIGGGDEGEVYDNGDGTVTKVFKLFNGKEADVNQVAGMFDRLAKLGIKLPQVHEIGQTEAGRPAMVFEKVGNEYGDHLQSQMLLNQLTPAERLAAQEQYQAQAKILVDNGLTIDWQMKNMIFHKGSLYIVDPGFIKEDQPLSQFLIDHYSPR